MGFDDQTANLEELIPATMNKNIRHNVYVVRLDPAVLNNRKFLEANPTHQQGKPCLYVGMTGLTPEERFENHKSGYKSNRYVRKYGIELVPNLYAHKNPMTYEKAKEMEPDLAMRLRASGFAVWQN